MANLPEASVQIDETAGALAGGIDYLVVMSPVSQNADMTPRIFASTKSILALHNYSQGADYAALHFAETRKPVIFVGMPIEVPGVLGSFDNSGMAGTSLVTVSGSPLDEVDGSVTFLNSGTVGTDQLLLSLSCDGGTSTQTVRLGAGTVVQGDVFLFRSTAPLWNAADLTTVRNALANNENLARSWLVCGDVDPTLAGNVVTEISNYETANQRFEYARTSAKDTVFSGRASRVTKTAQLAGDSVTFAASGHTITRSAGSFITDGFAVGDVVTVAGTTSNNGTLGALTGLSATVMTFASGVVNEGPLSSGVTITGSAGYVFDGTAHTITRSSGSFKNDGFAVGDSVLLAGTSSNNGTFGPIAALTDTVMTFGSGLTNETVASGIVSMTKSLTMATFVAASVAAFASIQGESEKRIDISLGRGRKESQITSWELRRPAAWAASLREYQHDLHIPCWRKADGPCLDWSLTDANGNTVEFDQRTDGGALEGLFTCFRTWANGPSGAFIALSLTRDLDGAFLSRTQNLAVADLACTVVQIETENAIGQVLQLNDNGTGTDASLSLIEERVNTALQDNLLKDVLKEGPRASNAVWTASRTDVLSTPGSTLTGSLALNLNGTIEKIATVCKVS
jgi:hypothetical protein